jgi:hypothetical protein
MDSVPFDAHKIVIVKNLFWSLILCMTQKVKHSAIEVSGRICFAIFLTFTRDTTVHFTFIYNVKKIVKNQPTSCSEVSPH